MQIFLLIRDPDTARQRIRGVFTTTARARSHDPELRGTWPVASRKGWSEVNAGSLTGKHHIVRPALANEELEIYADPDAQNL